MRVLIDTSVLIRALLPSTNPNRAVAVIVRAAVAGTFTLLLPPDLITELLDTTRTRPYLSDNIPPLRTEEFISLLESSGEPLQPLYGPFPPVCRDPKDNYLLAYAMAARADLLVSGDDHLLGLAAGQFPFTIVPPGPFVVELRTRNLLPHA